MSWPGAWSSMLAVICLAAAGCGGVGSGSSQDALTTDAGLSGRADYLLLDLGSGTLTTSVTAPAATAGDVIVFRHLTGGAMVTGVLQTQDPRSYADTEEIADNSSAAQHQRSLTPYFVSLTEMTQAQWARIAGLPAPVAEAGALPQTGVPYDEVVIELAGYAKAHLRLPTAAEWEYACRGAAPQMYAWGQTIDDAVHPLYANLAPTHGAAGAPAVAPVAARQGNAFGLFDLHGNVWEMTADTDATRVFVRGGSYLDHVITARASNRVPLPKDVGHPLVGFRLVLVP